MSSRRIAQAPVGATAGLAALLHVYRDCSLGFRLFLAHRWWHARLPEVERLVPPSGLVLDLGCGHGVVANLMGLRSPARRVIGLEREARKVAMGRDRLTNVEIWENDVLEVELPAADVVIICDVLHHLQSHEAQHRLLDRAVACLGDGGVLLVKEVTRSRPWRYRATLVLDRIAYPRGRFFFLPHEDLCRMLEERGFAVQMVPLWSRVPYAHYAVVCRPKA